VGVSKTLLLIMPKRRQVFNKLARLFLASLLLASVVGTTLYVRTLASHANIRIGRKKLVSDKNTPSNLSEPSETKKKSLITFDKQR